MVYKTYKHEAFFASEYLRIIFLDLFLQIDEIVFLSLTGGRRVGEESLDQRKMLSTFCMYNRPSSLLSSLIRESLTWGI